MTKTIIVAFGLGYLASWIIHGKLIKRVKNTFYYARRGHSYKQAWHYAGITL